MCWPVFTAQGHWLAFQVVVEYPPTPCACSVSDRHAPFHSLSCLSFSLLCRPAVVACLLCRLRWTTCVRHGPRSECKTDSRSKLFCQATTWLYAKQPNRQTAHTRHAALALYYVACASVSTRASTRAVTCSTTCCLC